MTFVERPDQRGVGGAAASALTDRADYPTLEHGAYLNQASLGLIGAPAIAAMHAFLDDVARHGNLRLSDADEAAFLDDLRTHASELLAVSAPRVAVVASASELLGQAPALLAPPPGSRVLAVRTDFPAITRPWLRLAARGGCTVEFVDDDPTRDLTDDLVERLGGDTAVVAVGWVQYATGTMIDVPRLRAAATAADARLVLDVTQGAGAAPIGDDAWGADLAVTSGYKWLGGHGGVAVGALAADLVEQTPPAPGWLGAADPFDFDATSLSVAPDARRFTQSTMSYVSVVGLTTALRGLLAVGLDEVRSHALALRSRLLATASDVGWEPFRGPEDPGASPHIVSLSRDGAVAAQAARRLAGHGVVVSGRGDRIRVSLAHYNNRADVDSLVSAWT